MIDHIAKTFEIAREKDPDRRTEMASELCEIVRPMYVWWDNRWSERVLVMGATSLVWAVLIWLETSL